MRGLGDRRYKARVDCYNQYRGNCLFHVFDTCSGSARLELSKHFVCWSIQAVVFARPISLRCAAACLRSGPRPHRRFKSAVFWTALERVLSESLAAGSRSPDPHIRSEARFNRVTWESQFSVTIHADTFLIYYPTIATFEVFNRKEPENKFFFYRNLGATA